MTHPERKRSEPIDLSFKDTDAAFAAVQELRGQFDHSLIDQVEVRTRDEAIERATTVVDFILRSLKTRLGHEIFDRMDPGHGSGHLARDYVAALRIAKDLEADPRQLFVGLVSGVMHDIGCAVVKRYDESRKPVRHADAGALLVQQVLRGSQLVNPAERTSIAYAVAASTHYLREQTIIDKDNGKEYRIQPYPDMDVDGKLCLEVWLPRWADRLDCVGPTHVGRHFLTQAESHSDFDGNQFYNVKFEEHMRPVLRTAEEIKAAGGKQTMVEHFAMFANTQTNDSPYGRHDYGLMVKLRDAQRARSMKIIEAVVSGSNAEDAPDAHEVMECWWEFLSQNIEPNKSGHQVIGTLQQQFAALPVETQRAWIRGFRETLVQYCDWADDTLRFIHDELSPSILRKMPFGERLGQVITPSDRIRRCVQS